MAAYRNGLALALNHITTPAGLDNFLSEKHITQLTSAFADLILKQFPNIKANDKLSGEITNYCYINVSRCLVYDLGVLYKKK